MSDRQFVCKNCGGTMEGDGYTKVFHCEFADEEDYVYCEPDASPVYCIWSEEYENP